MIIVLKNILITTLRISVIVIFFMFGLAGIFYISKMQESSLNYNTNVVVAHAGGGADGKIYLNIQEAFFEHYQNGTRYFEYDFMFSSDNQVICTHAWEYLEGYSNENRISYQEYLDYNILGKYKGVTLNFLFDIIVTYPDVKIILDTKEKQIMPLIEAIITKAELENINIFSAFIPQIYSRAMLEEIKNYPFEEFIFTNYKVRYTQNTIIDLINEEPRIKIVVMPWIDNIIVNNKKFLQAGAKLAVHTLNIKLVCHLYFNTGAQLVYSDFLYNNDFIS